MMESSAVMRRLLEEDHHVVRPDGRLRCPLGRHADNNPSCMLYPDDRGGHLWCFSCQVRMDVFEYRLKVRRMSRREAYLAANDDAHFATAKPARRDAFARPTSRTEARGARSSPLATEVVERHLRASRGLDIVPAALRNRGFDVADLRKLRVARDQGDALLAIPNERGDIVRIKRRFAQPRHRGKYTYEADGGSGAPPWFSPGFGSADQVLVVEGELNAMAIHLAQPVLDVIGMPGVSSSLPTWIVSGRSVVLYADPDQPGQAAVARWARQAYSVTRDVRRLPSWADGDACDVAGRLGRADLARRLRCA